jgi:uncharacterized protein
MIMNQHLLKVVTRQPYPLLFMTISGSHSYGFSSADSDYDLRGVHILPIREIIGLNPAEETIELSEITADRLQIDLVTHDLKKFLGLLLKKNGYVLEQLYSPLVVTSTPEHEELKEIATGCITCHHSHHYFGFARTQWQLFLKENPPRVKPLLYVFRVLMTGIHLMETGTIEANILKLNQRFNLGYIPELVERKISGGEQSGLNAADIKFYQGEYERLCQELEAAFAASHLPAVPNCQQILSDWLVRVRLDQKSGYT